ncbi:hypothetical protein GGF32_003115 [Allomyces javanicus]|nr:hypothetical protein GGF32_003115 [Allomyces javanicus]
MSAPQQSMQGAQYPQYPQPSAAPQGMGAQYPQAPQQAMGAQYPQQTAVDIPMQTESTDDRGHHRHDDGCCSCLIKCLACYACCDLFGDCFGCIMGLLCCCCVGDDD